MIVPSESEQKKFWDDWVCKSYEWQDNPDNSRRGAYVLNEVSKLDQKKLKILDVGCGSGWLARELQKYGEVTATDLSAKAIQELETRFSDIKWIAGDFLTIELPEDFYDIVTCLETIAHVPDQKAFAKHISKVTRAGGLLLLTTQNEYVWSRTSWLKPPGKGQIRNWPSRELLFELFGSYYSLEKILTCAPGGDRGVPRLINNRISKAVGRRVFGDDNWIKFREKIGLGKSLFLKGKRL